MDEFEVPETLPSSVFIVSRSFYVWRRGPSRRPIFLWSCLLDKSTEIIRYAGCGLSPSTYVAARLDISEYVAASGFILLEEI